MTLPVLLDQPPDTTAPVLVNWSRWISRCSGPGCRNAWQVEITAVLWMCHDCWTVNRPAWPADLGAIAYVLAQRPDPFTRNWEPGETITDLLMENAQHGIVPDELEPGTDDVLTEVDGRVVSGVLLPAIERARALIAEAGPAAALPRPPEEN